MTALPAEVYQKRYYTVAEWEKLPENPRYELIDGELVLMARLSSDHQSVNMGIAGQLWYHLRGKRCKVFSELSVRFHENDDTIFVPDLIVVCDRSKIMKNYCIGAPDLIVEIISPSSVRIDRILKLNRYYLEKVREYWIVDPMYQIVEVYQWDNGLCLPRIFGSEERVKVGVLDDCEIDLSLVFPEPVEEETPG